MEYTYTPDYNTLGQVAARWVAREVLRQPEIVLGLPTGSTPISMYKALTLLVQEGLVSFSRAQSFNLDEYVGLDANNPQSYSSFMWENFWGKVDIPAESIHIPKGTAPDLEAECHGYDDLIESAGGIDLQILGLGLNGHIGFNEPSHNLTIRTHVVDLTPETILANARFFPNLESVPRRAITMGIGSIMKAKKILLLVSGENKRKILQDTLFGTVSTEVPASILQLHTDLTVISDIKIDTPHLLENTEKRG